MLLASLLLAATLVTQTRPVPSARQLAWHKLETCAFVHFGPNTFSGNEWGTGKENPNSFNPTELDCRQWARSFKAGGFKGVILTAKHHDGFCLWPSKLSTHTVANSPCKHDILKDLSQACKAEGLKFGVYLSPWDRNHPAYGTDAYNDTFVGMLEEVLTNYGPIFEVWFDGANGEGPNGKRQVYDWDRYISTVRRLQPNAVIFSDAGPDVRWVGNEDGIAPKTCWATIQRDRYHAGTPLYKELGEGDPNGANWVPAECDVSIRPGWFWRSAENDKVKTPVQLEELFYKSVGHGAAMLLNVPPDSRGLIHENDLASMVAFHKTIKETFKSNLAPRNGGLVVKFKQPVKFDRIELAEDITQGQRVSKFAVIAKLEDKEMEIASETTIGRRRILRFKPTLATEIEVRIIGSLGAARLRPIKIFASPDCR
ncbi:MAG: alpha-L-fucosidase [Armatimonadetes bacterium]|nr:alpha-L-fucosidase [Armatimonadota bacterium]